MRIRLHIDKNTALLAGKDVHGTVVVDRPAADLNEAQRVELARHATAGNDREADYEIYPKPHIPEVTPEVVPAVLDSLIERHKAERAARDAETADRIRAVVADPDNCSLGWNYQDDDLALVDEATRNAYLAVRQRREEREAEERAREEKRRAEYAAEQEAKEKANAEGEARLRAWATEQGSQLLRDRVEGGFEWTKLAEREYALDAVAEAMAGGWLRDEAEDPEGGYEHHISKDRTTPTQAEIDWLKTVRGLVDEDEVAADRPVKEDR
jgi:hypothetical protein